MPTERRKIQNRVNQRRYRMQIKNRIQMLEKAVIDSGMDTVLDLGLSKPGTRETDGASPERQSLGISSSDSEAEKDSDFLNSGQWDVNLSPGSLDETNSLASPDFFGNWNQVDFPSNQGTSPLTTPESNQQFLEPMPNISHRFIMPWQEQSTSQILTEALALSPARGNSINYQGLLYQSKESLSSKSACSQPKKSSTTTDRNEAKKPPTGQRKARDPKEKTIAALREENKRLKELSTALVNMYHSTAKSQSSVEELGHNLPATVKNVITWSSAHMLPDSVLDAIAGSGVAYSPKLINAGLSENEELGLTQSPMLDLQLSEPATELIGSLGWSQRLPKAVSPGEWDSHPIHAFAVGDIPFSNLQAMPPLSYDAKTCRPTITPLLRSLALPSSHAYLEPTFSRRLVRLLWEYAFKVLTNADTPLSEVKRCFGFCLRSRSKDTLIQKFNAYLGLSSSPISELDRQIWNTAPDVRDSMEGGSDEWGYWIEAGKVETYLESMGFSLTENCDEAPLKSNWALFQDRHLVGKSGVSSTSTQTPVDDIQIPRPAPQIPYGSKWQPELSITSTLFDDDGNFKVPASWLMHDVVDATEGLVTPSTKCPAHLNAELFTQSQSESYLDVDRFFTGLIDVAVCLGRAAGFRREDVDEVLKKCLVTR